jgi:periplasmic protein TonB
MNKDLILKSDVLDILFDKRNKDYGAYNLRKFYNNRLVKSLTIMLGSVVVLSAFTFLPNKKVEIKIPDDIITRSFEMPKDKKDVEKDKPKEQPKKSQAPQQRILTVPKIVAKVEPKDSIVAIDPNIKSGPVTIVGTPIPGDEPVVNPGGGGDTVAIKPVKPVAPTVNLTTPRNENEVDVMPTFPGGMDALHRFLQNNLSNPRDMEEDESVSVKVKFVVGYDGKLQSFVTVQDGGDDFNKEVMRVLKKMPNWIPGKAKGQNVPVNFTIPIKFVPGN